MRSVSARREGGRGTILGSSNDGLRWAVRRRIGGALVPVQELRALSIAAPLGRVTDAGYTDLIYI